MRIRFGVAFAVLLFPLFCSAQEIEDRAFVAACDGSEQRYVVLKPAGFQEDQPHDVLIALHGHGSDRWQFIKGNFDESRACRDVATERKMLYISPDYRAKTSWMGPKAEADVLQIIETYRKRPAVRRVFLCGASMGGSSSLTFAAMHPDKIDGVASMNGTANHLEYEQFQDAISESFGGSKRDIPLEYKRRSAEYWPEKLTMPVGMTTGGKDVLVPPESIVRLAGVLAKLNPDTLLIHRPETGHTTNYEDSRAILEFMLQRADAAAAKK
jgi:pimeloyl-ACP methyl ester carboxylesterase